MISGLYQSAAGMLTQMENHQVIAENLAASSTPGHRRSQISFETYLNPPSVNTGDPNEVVSQSGHALWPAHVPRTRTTTVFSQGQIHEDGVPSHVAINGRGFFSVELPNNAGTAYTRNGMFHINDQGELRTMDGMRVLSGDGDAIVIPKPSTPILISGEGEISQAQDSNTGKLTVIGKIAVSDFKEPSRNLRETGGGYFIPNDAAVQPDPSPAETLLVQGATEGSNSNPMEEMVALMQAVRSYEANQKMLQAQDSTLEQIIQKIPAR